MFLIWVYSAHIHMYRVKKTMLHRRVLPRSSSRQRDIWKPTRRVTLFLKSYASGHARCSLVVAFFSEITTLSLTNRRRVRSRDSTRCSCTRDASLLKKEDTHGKIKARQRQPSIRSPLLFLSLFPFCPFSFFPPASCM